MAGQSLAPSEHRTESIGTIIALGGLGEVLILIVTFAAWELFRRRE
jgi:hypothetical protein